MADYVLADEPAPSGWAQYTVRPFWILLALMLVGAWLAFPWFIFNAHAVGSPTKAREMGLSVAYFACAVVLAILCIAVVELGLLPKDSLKYLVLLVLALKLGLGYWVTMLQARTFSLYEEFGGVVRSPVLFMIAGFMVKGWVVPTPSNLWTLVAWMVLS